MVLTMAPLPGLGGAAYADADDIGIPTVTWSGKTVSWTAVEGAEKYTVACTMFEGEDYSAEVAASAERTVDLTEFVNSRGGSRYVVQVRAVIGDETGNPGQREKYFRDVEVSPVYKTYPYSTYYSSGTDGGTVAVSSSAGETFTGPDDNGKYKGVVEQGATVTVTATAAEGYHLEKITDRLTDEVSTTSPYSFEVANADYFIYGHFLQNEPEKVTLTLKWSSIDGETPVEDQQVQIESGTSFRDLDYADREAALGAFSAEGYSRLSSSYGAYLTPDPITSYSSMEEAAAADQCTTDLTGDTTLYVLMGVVTSSGSVTVERPVCGTEVEFDDETYAQTNTPVLTANEGSHLIPAGGSGMPASYWVSISEGGAPVFFDGTIEGGVSYSALASIEPAFGYTLGNSFGSTLDIEVTNADEGSVTYTPGMGLQFTVTAAHDPAAPVEENRVEPTTATEGSYEEVVYCDACGAEISRETKTIPKLPEYITVTVHGSSREGDDFGDPIVIENVPKGSTYNEALAIAGETIGSIAIEPVDGYKYYAAWNLKKPLSTYSTSNEAFNDRFTGNEILNEDTDAYIPYSVRVPAAVTLTPPVCGTDTSSLMEISVPEGAKWYAGTPHQQWWQYSGDIQGGSVYEYYIIFDLTWGYYSDSSTSAAVNGGEFSGNQMTGDTRYGFRVKVTAVHDWDDGVVISEATETEEGEKLFTCKACGETKTEVIPAIINIQDAEVVLTSTAYTYNGKVHKPSISTIGGMTLTEGTDYTAKWSAASPKNVGAYTVTITGTGAYTGTTKATFRINPKGASLKAPKKAKKAITVRWKKQSAKMSSSRITGYQIQVATDKQFTKNKKTVTVKGYSKTSKKIKKLKGGKKYYVRIRTYKIVNGTKYYSPWSGVKTVKTKK